MSVKDKRFQTLAGLGNDGSNYVLQTTGAGATSTSLQDPTGAGLGLIGKFQLTSGDKRIELSGHVDRDPTFETEYWARWNVFIPATWTQTTEPQLFLQIHEEPDTSPADFTGQAQFIGRVLNDKLQFRHNYCVLAQTTQLSDITSRELFNVPLASYLNKWTEVVLRAKWSFSGAGVLELYVNGLCVFREKGISNAFNNSPGRGGGDAYHKLGLYDDASTAGVTNYVYHDGVMRGIGYSSYSDFSSACGFNNKEIVPVNALVF